VIEVGKLKNGKTAIAQRGRMPIKGPAQVEPRRSSEIAKANGKARIFALPAEFFDPLRNFLYFSVYQDTDEVR